MYNYAIVNGKSILYVADSLKVIGDSVEYIDINGEWWTTEKNDIILTETREATDKVLALLNLQKHYGTTKIYRVEMGMYCCHKCGTFFGGDPDEWKVCPYCLAVVTEDD